MPVQTVDTKIVLGWMERDFAVNYLVNECVFDPPLSQERALAHWEEYRAKVDALPEREANAPTRLPLNREERQAAEEFLRFHRNLGPAGSVRDVIKIDPIGLVAYQFYVILDKVAEYTDHVMANTWCARNCLAKIQGPHNIQISHRLNAMDISVPHGEFAFIFNQQLGRFDVIEQARHVSVTAFQNRMILWAGYHRSYARMASANPDGTDRSLLVALTTDADFFVSAQSPNQGLRAMVCGSRPCLLGDFLDASLFIQVKLRKKRFQLQVRSQVVPINDDSIP
ncbi:MAG: hypothetical protein ABSF14_02805 [Terriglobia bacterium]